jgi:hypothetical protein
LSFDSRVRWIEREKSRFLKKAAQKLLLIWAMGADGANAHGPA